MVLVVTACAHQETSGPVDAYPQIEHTIYHSVPIVAGQSPRLEIELPLDVISFSMTALGDGDILYCIDGLYDPDGQALVSNELSDNDRRQDEHLGLPWPGPYLSPNRSACVSPGITTLLAPNNSEVFLRPGNWSFTVDAQSNGQGIDSEVDVIVHTRRGPAALAAGILDLHLFFSGSRGWTAETAARDPQLRQVLDRVSSIYAQADITIRVLSWNDLDENHLEVSTASRPPMGELNAGELLTLNSYEEGIGVFIVDFLSDESGGPLAGLSYATPGPAFLPNTRASGIIVSTRLADNVNAIADIMAHELGHYLGLFHTEEVNGIHFDQLHDTPVGAAAERNLMYPILSEAERELSESQAKVTLGHPVLHHQGGE